MKTIKTLLLVGMSSILLSALTSCTDYQDEIDALDGRVTYLESLVNAVNADLNALRVIADAMKDGDYITDVKPTPDGKGYTINFKKYGIVTIIDGQDGTAPNVTVRQDPITGDWCWVINGEWLMVNGEKVRANGKDGKDGITPEVRIDPNTGMWEYSPDGGTTWISTGTVATGNDGQDGKDGNLFFQSVTYQITEDGEFMIVVTKSGQTFRIPIYRNTDNT